MRLSEFPALKMTYKSEVIIKFSGHKMSFQNHPLPRFRQAPEHPREYFHDYPVPHLQRLLSRRKRQDLLFGGGGLLKDIFGVAYTTDVHGLSSSISEAEDRLNIQVKRTKGASIHDVLKGGGGSKF